MANPRPSWLREPDALALANANLANIFDRTGPHYISPYQRAQNAHDAQMYSNATEEQKQYYDEKKAGISMPSPPRHEPKPHRVKRGQRDLPSCIEQVNKFDTEVLPMIKKIILYNKNTVYWRDLAKINDLVSPGIWTELPLDINIKEKMIKKISGDNHDDESLEYARNRLKLIADTELLEGLLGTYDNKKRKAETEKDEEQFLGKKCSAFEELSRQLYLHSFFKKDKFHTGILSHIDYEDVNYKSPRIFEFDSKRRSVKRTKKRSMKTQKRRSPKRSIKRKSPKKSSVKRRSAKSNKSKNKKNKKSKNKKSKKSKNKKSLKRK